MQLVTYAPLKRQHPTRGPSTSLRRSLHIYSFPGACARALGLGHIERRDGDTKRCLRPRLPCRRQASHQGQRTHRVHGPTLVFAMNLPALHSPLFRLSQTTYRSRLTPTQQTLDPGTPSPAGPADLRARKDRFGLLCQACRHADRAQVPRAPLRRRPCDTGTLARAIP